MGARRFRSADELASAGRFGPGSVLLFNAGALHREYDNATIGWRSTDGTFFPDANLAAIFERYGSVLEVRLESEVAAEALELFATDVVEGRVDPRLSTATAAIVRTWARRYRDIPNARAGAGR